MLDSLPVMACTRRARQLARAASLTREKEAAWQGSIPRSERGIPAYDPRKDPHCRILLDSQCDAGRQNEIIALASSFMHRDSVVEHAGFAAVAAILGFKHHEGMDPGAEIVVLKALLRRETLLSQIEAAAEQLVRRARQRRALQYGQCQETQLMDKVQKRALVDLMTRLRETTVDVCEAIAKWRSGSNGENVPCNDSSAANHMKRNIGHLPRPFLWQGSNYLLKVAKSDLDFVGTVAPFAFALGVQPSKMCRNPLMLPRTLDEAAADLIAEKEEHSMTNSRRIEALLLAVDNGFEMSHNIGSKPQACDKMQAAEMMLVTEELLEKERGIYLRHPANKSLPSESKGCTRSSAADKNDESLRMLHSSTYNSLPAFDSSGLPVESPVKSVNGGWSPSERELIAWYDDAQTQLLRLREVRHDFGDSGFDRRRVTSAGSGKNALQPLRFQAIDRRQKRASSASASPYIVNSRNAPILYKQAKQVKNFISHPSRGKDASEPQLAASNATPRRARGIEAPRPSSKMNSSPQDWGILGSDDRIKHATAPSVVAPKKRKKKLQSENATSEKLLALSTAASQHATEARTSAMMAVAEITSSVLKGLSKIETPPESLARLGAAVKTLATPGEAVPTDLRWPTILSSIRTNPQNLVKAIHAVDPASIAGFKRRALHRFLTFSNARKNSVRLRTLASDAADSAHRLDAWVRAVLAASEACLAAAEAAKAVDVTKASLACSDAALGAATASAALRRGKPGHKRRSVSKTRVDARRNAHAGLLFTTIRNDVEFDHSQSKEPSPWLVSVFNLHTDGYEVRVYHVVTSYETSLLVSEDDASVAAMKSGYRYVDNWAREVLPFCLKLSRYGENVTLYLSEFVPSFCTKLRQQPDTDSLPKACQLSFEWFLAFTTRRGRNFSSISEYLPSELVGYLTSTEFERQCADAYNAVDIDKNSCVTVDELSPLLFEIAVQHKMASDISLGDCNKIIALFDCHGKRNMTKGGFIELCRFVLAAGKLRVLETNSVYNALDLLAKCVRNIQTIVKVLPQRYAYYLDSEEFKEECDLRFQVLDIDRSNTLTNDEVCPIIVELANLRDDTCILPEHTELVFTLFDTDLSGSIDRLEFLRFAKYIFAIRFLEDLKNRIEILVPRSESSSLIKYDVKRAAAQRESLDFDISSVEAKNAHMAKLMSKLPHELVHYLQSKDFKGKCADHFNATNSKKHHALSTSDVVPLVIHLASLHSAFAVNEEQCDQLIQYFIDKEYVVTVDAYVFMAQFVLATSHISGNEDKRTASILATIDLGKDHVQEMLKWTPTEMTDFLESREARELSTKRFDRLRHVDIVEGNTKNGDSIHPHMMQPIIRQMAGVQCTEDECIQIALTFDDDDDGDICVDEFISCTKFLISFAYMSELKANLDMIFRNGSNGTFESADAKFELPSFARSKCTSIESDKAPLDANMTEAQTFLYMRRLLSRGAEHLSEVLQMLPESLAESITSEELISDCMLRYDEVDVDNNGRLSALEVWPVVLELANDKTKVQLSEADRDDVLEDLFAKFDVNGNENIDRTEFVAFVQFVLICRYIDTMLENQQPDEISLRLSNHDHITFDPDDACRVYNDLVRLKEGKHAREILARLDDQVAREILDDSFNKKCLEQFDALHRDARECVAASELIPVIAKLANDHSDLVIDEKKYAELINIYDSEGKGMFSRDEFVSLSQFVLACAYLDGRSRKISFDKFRVDVIMNALEQGKSHFDEVLTKLPAHHAGYLLSHKFQDECLRNFDELDKNRDGLLSKSELYPVTNYIVEMWDVIDDAMTHDQFERFFHLFQGEGSSSEKITRDEFVRLSQFVLVMALILQKEKQGSTNAPNSDVENADVEQTLVEEGCVEDMLALLGNGRANMRQVITRLPEDLADFVTSEKFVSGAVRRYEEELDRNGDGILSASEISPIVSELAGVHDVAVRPEHAEKMVQLFDLDASGTIDRSEYVEATQFIFIFAYLENQRERHRKRRASEDNINAIAQDESFLPINGGTAILDVSTAVYGNGAQAGAAGANTSAEEIELGVRHKNISASVPKNSAVKNRAALVIQTQTRRRRALRHVGRLRRQSASRNLAATKIQSQVRRRQVADPVQSRQAHGEYEDDFVDEINEIGCEDDASTFLLEHDDDDDCEDVNFADAEEEEYADYDEDFDSEPP